MNQVSKPHKITRSPEQASRNVERAMEILNKGASSPVERDVVQKAFDHVQKIKRGSKGKYSASLRYEHALTLHQRDAAKEAAKKLKQALTILEPVAGCWQLNLEKYDLALLENIQRDLQIIGNNKLHGSKFDDRPLRAVKEAVGLLKAVGKGWTTERDKDADTLTAALWGEPDKDFQEYLRRYNNLRRGSRRDAQPGTD